MPASPLPSRLTRWGGLAGMLLGLTVAADHIVWKLSLDPDNWDCNSSYDYVTNTLESAALFLLAGVLAGLHARHGGRYGRLGRAGFLAAFTGSLMAGTSNPLEHCLDLRFLGWWLWVPGTLLLTAGVLLLGIAVIRARALPGWWGWAMILGMLALVFAANRGGALLFALVWAGVGYLLWSGREQHTDRQSPQ